MNSRNGHAVARLPRGLSAAGQGWDRGCDGAARVLRSIGRDALTGLALAAASGFDPGWPLRPPDLRRKGRT